MLSAIEERVNTSQDLLKLGEIVHKSVHKLASVADADELTNFRWCLHDTNAVSMKSC